MAPSLFSGWGKQASKIQNPIDRSLPASWYRSPALYQLERRAIFSQSWLLITHKSRFIRPGDFLRYEVAGFPFLIVLVRKGEILAFHNVCRHRAYPIVQEDSGNASIFACKYHGWSYGLSGSLAKAPRFDEVAGFDKSRNGLLPVHIHVDQRGFVWINLEAGEKPRTPWTDAFHGADVHPRLKAFDINDYTFDHTWDMDGQYNWKTLVDNYNECYHCGTAHPGIAAVSDLTTYNVETVNGQIQHFVQSKPGLPDDPVAPTFFFPNASVTMTEHYFYMMRVVPVSETTTSMQYEVYRNRKSSNEDFQEMDKFFKQVEHEDKNLCNAAQKNLNSGSYVVGELHPHNEKGVLYFQKTVKQRLLEHKQNEDAQGCEIWPSRQKTDRYDGVDEETSFCRSLENGKYDF